MHPAQAPPMPPVAIQLPPQQPVLASGPLMISLVLAGIGIAALAGAIGFLLGHR
jgi:hypothetical protein